MSEEKKIFEEIKIHLLADDDSIVVFRVRHLTRTMADHYEKGFEELYPNRKCLIIDKDTEIEVIKENE